MEILKTTEKLIFDILILIYQKLQEIIKSFNKPTQSQT
jgi:hypothetical protein